jgi:hypothetical protein
MSHRFFLSLVSATLVVTGLAATTLAQQGKSEDQPSLPRDDCQAPTLITEESRPVETISIDIHRTDGDRQPKDCSGDLFSPSPHAPGAAIGRCAACERQFQWVASGLYHQPLYFEQVPLEYYGQSCHPCLQPWVSGAHFFGSFLVMPYKIGVDHPHSCVYELGYYRPGTCAPCVRQRLPFEWDASALEAGSWLALIFVLP